MYSIIVLICLACLTECQYDPSVQVSEAGYEEAEQHVGPQVIPAEYGQGKEQLKYVDERENIDVFQEFDQVFDLFKEYVKDNNFGHTEKDLEYAGRLDEIHVQWKHTIEEAPVGVQQDFASTLTTIFNVLTSRRTLNLFNSLVDLWNSFSGTFSRIFQDAPMEPVQKPDWQIDFENAIRQKETSRKWRLRRHHRSVDNNELESSELGTLAFARQTTRGPVTTRRATTQRTTTRRAQTTTRRAQATTRRAQATTRRAQATTRRTQATTRRTQATRNAQATTRNTARTTRQPATTRRASQSAKQTVEQEQNVDVDNGVHETYIKASRIINVFVDDDQPAELIAQAVAAQYFEFEKGDPNP